MITDVISNAPIINGATLYDLRVYAPDAARDVRPGQFAHIYCGKGTTLRRPISIAGFSDGVLRFCYDVRGKGTEYLSGLKKGDKLDIMAPLGRGFSPLENGRALLVGGGIGIYPLLPLAEFYGRRARALLGFRNAGIINLTDEFSAFGTEVSVITDDGSSGRRGFVTGLVKEALDGGQWDIVHVCGPKMMMKSVCECVAGYGVPVEVSMEERMACGVGACMGCVCKIKDKNGEPTYKRVCKDGPVFDGSEVIWE